MKTTQYRGSAGRAAVEKLGGQGENALLGCQIQGGSRLLMILKNTNKTRIIVRKTCFSLYFIYGSPGFSILDALMAAVVVQQLDEVTPGRVGLGLIRRSIVSTRILGRRTAPITPFRIPHPRPTWFCG